MRPPRTFSRLRSPNSTAPRLGRSASWISLSRVLLPAPEWPVTNSISPASTAKLTSDRAVCPPGYCLLTLSKRRTVIAGDRERADREYRPSRWPRPARPPELRGMSRIAMAGVARAIRASLLVCRRGDCAHPCGASVERRRRCRSGHRLEFGRVRRRGVGIVGAVGEVRIAVVLEHPVAAVDAGLHHAALGAGVTVALVDAVDALPLDGVATAAVARCDRVVDA